MRQQEIDQLLQSSDSKSQIKKKKDKKVNNQKSKKQQDLYAEQYDDFFQSEVQGDQKLNIAPKQKQTKKEQPSKFKQSNEQTNKNKSQQYEDQSKYLNSQDFEQSQISPYKKVNKSFNKSVSQLVEQKDDDYEQNFDQEPIQTQRTPQQSIKNQSQDLVKSQYTESRIRDDQKEINQNYDDEDIQTVKSSNIKSKILGDDDMSQVQSEYVDSFRGEEIKKHEFKKVFDKKVKENTIDMRKNKLPSNNGIKKQTQIKQNPKETFIKSNRNSTPQSRQLTAKNIPSYKKIEDNNRKNNIVQNKSQNTKKQLSSTQNKLYTKNLNVNENKKLTQSELKQKQEQHRQKMAQIENQRKRLQQIKMAKINKQKQIAMKEFEEMKKKQEQRKQKNKKILQQKLKQKQTIKNDTISRKNLGEMENLKLTQSKIKQLAQQEQKKKQQKAKMKTAEEMKKRRKKQQQMTRIKLQNQNKQKIKNLEQEKLRYFDKKANQKLFYQQKKKDALLERKILKQNFIVQKKQQIKQNQVPEVRKMKQEIAQLKEKIIQKQTSISDLEEVINKLKKTLKKKQQIKYSHDEELELQVQNKDSLQNIHFGHDLLQSHGPDQQLTSVQKFIRLFEQCNNSAQIFQLLDQNNDQMISIDEIKHKVVSLIINKNQSFESEGNDFSDTMRKSLTNNAQLNQVIEQVYQILDKNSDGSVTKNQFTFIIDYQLKKIQQFRQLVKDIPLKTPIDIQASILDMKQKIKYMQKKTNQELKSSQLDLLQNKYQKYLAKCQEYQKRLINTKEKINKNNQQNQSNLVFTADQTLKHDKIYFLRQQVAKLRLKKENQQKMLTKIRQKQAQNIKEKNLQLSQKVQENIRINEQIYKIKIKLQEQQLRFLSKQKIQQNRYRFAIKQSQQKQQYQEAIQRAKQFQAKILNPAKQIKFGNYANQVKYLAAVIMIQRNFRKRKAIKQTENLKANR